MKRPPPTGAKPITVTSLDEPPQTVYEQKDSEPAEKPAKKVEDPVTDQPVTESPTREQTTTFITEPGTSRDIFGRDVITGKMPPTPPPRFQSVTTRDSIQVYQHKGDLQDAPRYVLHELDSEEDGGFEDLGYVGAPRDYYKHIYFPKQPPPLQCTMLSTTAGMHLSPLAPSQPCKHSIAPSRDTRKRPVITVPPSQTKVRRTEQVDSFTSPLPTGLTARFERDLHSFEIPCSLLPTTWQPV